MRSMIKLNSLKIMTNHLLNEIYDQIEQFKDHDESLI
jgi:hypothetical protein